MEIKIDSLEDMCALMCDNRIPRKENKMNNVFECKCGDCKFHEYHGNEWYCMMSKAKCTVVKRIMKIIARITKNAK